MEKHFLANPQCKGLYTRSTKRDGQRAKWTHQPRSTVMVIAYFCSAPRCVFFADLPSLPMSAHSTSMKRKEDPDAHRHPADDRVAHAGAVDPHRE